MTEEFRLHGRLFIKGIIQTITGLHIGGSESAISIGGVDNTVVRDTITGQPYIPGSSLKGKMRSLLEKQLGAPQNFPIGTDVCIHVAGSKEEYENSIVSQIYGIPANDFSFPTRLVVRDVALTQDSLVRLAKIQTDLPFTEVKWEVAIDRVTSAATPRQLERVPAGAEFGPFELVYNIYEAGDLERFRYLIDSLSLLEDDYLGGSGSRGSGKIVFTHLTISYKHHQEYTAHKTLYPLEKQGEPYEEEVLKAISKERNLATLIKNLAQIKDALNSAFPF